MSMGYSGNFAITFEKEKIEAMNLESWAHFMSLLEEAKVTVEEYGCCLEDDGILYNVDGEVEETLSNNIDQAFETFQKEFKEKTGATINARYHYSEEHGDIYDEVDGFYFELDFNDLYQLTPVGKALSNNEDFKFKFFVTYG